MTITNDRDGRLVWAVDAIRFDLERDLSLIAHEQTHAILRGRFPEDPRARFLEEGFADYVEHLVMSHGGPRRAHVNAERRAALEATSIEGAPTSSSSVSCSTPRRYASTLAFMRAMCGRVTDRRGTPLTSPTGYALGLAYWLNRDAHAPGLLGRVLASRPRSIDALLRVTKDGEAGFSARHRDLAGARAQLATAD